MPEAIIPRFVVECPLQVVPWHRMRTSSAKLHGTFLYQELVCAPYWKIRQRMFRRGKFLQACRIQWTVHQNRCQDARHFLGRLLPAVLQPLLNYADVRPSYICSKILGRNEAFIFIDQDVRTFPSGRICPDSERRTCRCFYHRHQTPLRQLPGAG